jgi:hypothetical protein
MRYTRQVLIFCFTFLLSGYCRAQIFKDAEWGDETEVYNDGGTKVTIVFKKSPNSCDAGAKSNHFRFNITGVLQSVNQNIDVKF